MRNGNEHFVTCGQMKILERRADEDGLSYYQMMENAGTAAALAIMERIGSGFPPVAVAEAPSGIAAMSVKHERRHQALIFCGKGNNGGDGFVVARKMSESGFCVHVILVDGQPVTEDSVTNFRLLENMPVQVTDMTENERVLMYMRVWPDIIVDAIYGTGFHGSLSGNALRAAIYMNKFKIGESAESCADIQPARSAPADAPRPVMFSLDIPSGLGGDIVDEQEVDVNSVRADCTITFHARKPVHLQKFAARYCGDIIVADIGIDEERLWSV